MPAYKNKENGSWYVVTQYTDWTGERKPKCKRGFATRREALEWEQKFQQQSAGDLDMSFEAFCEIYTNDLKARPYSQTYLKTLHNQLSAIFNHAVRFYDLHSNPAAKAGNMGTE